MSTADYRPSKVFTVEQANAVLPLVRAITTDLVELSREVIERRQRLALLTAGRHSTQRDPYSDELSQIEEELDKDQTRLQGFVEELRELGVEPKSAEGLVDFPSQMDGRLVYLCWKLGEPEILHWHDIDAGFGGRQPLAAGSVAGGGAVGDSEDRSGENLLPGGGS
jgi:hypothetical protein